MPAPASPGAGPGAELASGPGSAPDGITRVALVVGTTAGGTGAHVRMLAAGLAERGIEVSVLGPSSADARFGFATLAGVTFAPVEFSDRPRPGDAAVILRLRRLLGSRPNPADPDPGTAGPDPGTAAPNPDIAAPRPGTSASGSAATGARRASVRPRATVAGAHPDVVHAHGLRAGALAALALGRVRDRRRRPERGGRPGADRPRLVVTVHNAPPSGRGARALIYRLLERLVARRADLVLCVSPDVEARMRTAGASRVGRAIVPAPDARREATAPADVRPAGDPIPGAGNRPVVLAVGRLAAQKDFATLIEAVARCRDLDPPPLLAIAGDGPLAGELRAQAAALGVDAIFLEHREDVPGLLKAATVIALPSRWEGQPLILQEALRAGAAIVATRVGGVPDLVGDAAATPIGPGGPDPQAAAMLVPPGDPKALAAAIGSILTDPALAARLRAAASQRARDLPTADDAITAALAAYADARSRP